MDLEATAATMLEVKKYFGYDKLSDFKRDWQELDDISRVQLRNGIGNGTLTY